MKKIFLGVAAAMLVSAAVFATTDRKPSKKKAKKECKKECKKTSCADKSTAGKTCVKMPGSK